MHESTLENKSLCVHKLDGVVLSACLASGSAVLVGAWSLKLNDAKAQPLKAWKLLVCEDMWLKA